MKKLIMFVGLLIGTQSFAAGYGAAGCGLGSMVMEGNQWWEQVIGATMNATGMQTFGISSGTSNCDAKALIDLSHMTSFIDANKKDVVNDMAKGQGETLTVLSKAFKCENTSEFSTLMQNNYESIFNANDSAKEMATKVNNLVKGSTTCQPLS